MGLGRTVDEGCAVTEWGDKELWKKRGNGEKVIKFPLHLAASCVFSCSIPTSPVVPLNGPMPSCKTLAQMAEEIHCCKKEL